jgi:pyruvate dehydrogenase E2 component (dihydrolipoyllysine-residue acetyltransferase)
MAIEITVPRLGWNMEEGIFQGWIKKDGDQVHAGESVFCLETDKATQEVESIDGGVLRISPDGPKEGDTVAVGTVIGYLVLPDEASLSYQELKATPASLEAGSQPDADSSPNRSFAGRPEEGLNEGFQHNAGSGSGGQPVAMEQPFQEQAEAGGRMSGVEADSSQSEVLQQTNSGLTPAISPRARRVANELAIDWRKIEGTGRTGRIREQDVRAAARKSSIGTDINSTEWKSSLVRHSFKPIPVTPTRRTIAQRMLTSARSTAPVTLTSTADAANLVNLRNQFKSLAASDADLIPGFTDFLVKLAAIALQKHPLLNAQWAEEQILVAQKVNIGIAVDTDEGLLVPVVHDVPALSLKQVAARSRDLIVRARQRKLLAEEMQAGTFTISNLGVLSVDAFTPIINSPECAILGLGRIRRQPVLVEDRVVAGARLTLSLTFDHRIVDGAPASRFLHDLVNLVENPGPPLMS